MLVSTDHRQLLCTFSIVNGYKETIREILGFYNVYNNRIFVFSNDKDSNEIFLTYNVVNMQRDAPKFPNTILIHRKKQTNTLYTLNAMNKLIEEENGSLDKSYVVNWKYYENSLIITGDVSIKIIPLKIHSVVNNRI